MHRSQSQIARWERGDVKPSLETLRELIRACGLELTFGLANYDDSYDHFIDKQLRLDPTERVASALQFGATVRAIQATARVV